MATRLDLGFPDDLLRAMTLSGTPLSFSTIQAGDTNPQMEGRGGAEGSVGVLVDIGPSTVIRSVSPHDSGSDENGSSGLPPLEQNCIDSIDKRATSNEWHIEDYVPAGMFILPPVYVRKVFSFAGQATAAEDEISLAEAIAPFDGRRVFSANPQTFLEYHRMTDRWVLVSWDEIFA